jgi:hypothetical protein
MKHYLTPKKESYMTNMEKKVFKEVANQLDSETFSIYLAWVVDVPKAVPNRKK